MPVPSDHLPTISCEPVTVLREGYKYIDIEVWQVIDLNSPLV